MKINFVFLIMLTSGSRTGPVIEHWETPCELKAVKVANREIKELMD